MKKFVVLLLCILIVAGISVGIYLVLNNSKEESLNSDNTGAILKDTRLTDDEKILTGIWENDDGWVLAIRERSLDDTNFSLDAIIYYPEYEQWFKVTRGESYIDEGGNGLELGDYHDCPVSDEPDAGWQETKEELIYDKANDTIIFTSYVEGEAVFWQNGSEYVESIIFHRTDKAITEAEAGWGWYYEIDKWKDPR